MSTKKWDTKELERISTADDLKISPFREDGVTYGTPTWIWNVAVKGELYVRPYYGEKSRWYQAAVCQKKGRIHAAGMVIEVSFEQGDISINDAIDEAYRSKYKGSHYLKHMTDEKSKQATIKIIRM